MLNYKLPDGHPWLWLCIVKCWGHSNFWQLDNICLLGVYLGISGTMMWGQLGWLGRLPRTWMTTGAVAYYEIFMHTFPEWFSMMLSKTYRWLSPQPKFCLQWILSIFWSIGICPNSSILHIHFYLILFYLLSLYIHFNLTQAYHSAHWRKHVERWSWDSGLKSEHQ